MVSFIKKLQQLNKQKKEQQAKRDYEIYQKQDAYSKTRTGKVAGYFSKALRQSQRPTIAGFAQTMYSRDQPSRPLSAYGPRQKGTIAGAGTGKRGRPRGSYDQRYAAYGGVYGYRKQLNAKLRIAKMEALRRATVNPQQQAVLNQIEARQRAIAQDPENQTFPDTRGIVRLKSINDEINDAANLVL